MQSAQVGGGEREEREREGREEFHTQRREGRGAKKHEKGILVSEVSRSRPIQFLSHSSEISSNYQLKH